MQLSFSVLISCSLRKPLLSLVSLSISLCLFEGFWVLMTTVDIRIDSLDTMDSDTNAHAGTSTAAGMDGMLRTFWSDSFLSGSKFGLHTILWEQIPLVLFQNVLSLGKDSISWW